MTVDTAIYAGFIRRGTAYLIDCFFAFAFFVATQLLFFTPIRRVIGIEESWFYSGINTELYTLLTVSLPIWLYFIFFEQSSWQATLGKRVLKLKVATETGLERIGSGRAFVRTLIKLIPWEMAHVVNNFPEPMMYASDPGFRLGFAGVGLLMGIYMLLVLINKQKQGPHDLVAKTVVVQTGWPGHADLESAS